MPHAIIEYSSNISEKGNIDGLLRKIQDVLLTHSDTFPAGGIRVRAYRADSYRLADGKEDDAFVHATLKIGQGRSEEVKTRVGNDVFAAIQSHFEELYKERYLALSLEIYEFQTATFKQNNLHERFK